MMKKYVLSAVAITVICITVLAVTRNSSMDRLSNREIRILREEYSINDNQPEFLDMRISSLEECVARCDVYAEIEIIGKPVEYIRTVKIDPNTPEGRINQITGIVTEFPFIKYEARIINDAFNDIEGTCEISYSSEFGDCMPILEPGKRYIVGGSYNSDYGTIDIGCKTVFYVTEDGYVLSVQSEISRNRHTGKKVDDLLSYLNVVKAETEEISVEIK
ncbi:MAG: hypothetical protein IJZ85_06615 [Lachnospiraceae bacterium]|nr:hypothetical protein [Lachnospiraceae bacterium]